MTNLNDMQFSWLMLEGVLPLTGAGILYLLWGFFRYTSTNNKAAFKYEWWEAVDPLGWLYGAVIISAQSASKGFTSGSHEVLSWMCIGGGFACLMLLLAAMTDRGGDAAWKPPASLQLSAALLVIMILYAGVEIRSLNLSGVGP
jgi:hypothetical protein